jgi:hypothetical protein
MSYYVPEWELPKVTHTVVGLATRFAELNRGALPQVVGVIFMDADFEPVMDFVLQKDRSGLFYESLHPVETNGVRKYLRVNVK